VVAKDKEGSKGFLAYEEKKQPPRRTAGRIFPTFGMGYLKTSSCLKKKKTQTSKKKSVERNPDRGWGGEGGGGRPTPA